MLAEKYLLDRQLYPGLSRSRLFFSILCFSLIQSKEFDK